MTTIELLLVLLVCINLTTLILIARGLWIYTHPKPICKFELEEDFEESSEVALNEHDVVLPTYCEEVLDELRKYENDEWEGYQMLFLTHRESNKKSGFTISTEVLDMLRHSLWDTKSKTTLTSYIENILLDHLRTYKGLINDAANRAKANQTIDL